jgi:hypothetical protein
MLSRSTLTVLVTIAIVLPIVTLVLLGVAGLLGAMQDPGGQTVVRRAADASAILWIIDLVLLLVGVGIDSLGRDRPSGD